MVVLRYTALIGRERSRDILGHAPGQGQDHLAYRTKVEIWGIFHRLGQQNIPSSATAQVSGSTVS